ncbi:hypothetical protein FRC08_009831 [Ceratobasidium sp. 394]|nr:hypothetical protein FRC08_009831 [Ceratobasidium sp. 394]
MTRVSQQLKSRRLPWRSAKRLSHRHARTYISAACFDRRGKLDHVQRVAPGSTPERTIDMIPHQNLDLSRRPRTSTADPEPVLSSTSGIERPWKSDTLSDSRKTLAIARGVASLSAPVVRSAPPSQRAGRHHRSIAGRGSTRVDRERRGGAKPTLSSRVSLAHVYTPVAPRTHARPDLTPTARREGQGTVDTRNPSTAVPGWSPPAHGLRLWSHRTTCLATTPETTESTESTESTEPATQTVDLEKHAPEARAREGRPRRVSTVFSSLPHPPPDPLFDPLFRRDASAVERTMSTASVMTVQPDDVFTSVVDYPGVVSCPALRQLKIGIVASYDYLCCIHCPRLRLLKLSSAPAHAHSHMKNKRAHSTNAMLALFSKYNVYNGRVSAFHVVGDRSTERKQIADLPVPPYPSPPLPFLPEAKGVQCTLCEDVGVRYAVESEDTMANHFKGHKKAMAKHKGGPRPVKAVTVQTFCGGHRSKKWFVVIPAMAGPPDPEDLHSSPAAPQEMLRATIKSWRPVDHGPVSVSSAKDVQPWLHFNGWVAHTSKYDPAFLCQLVETPEEGSPLGRIVKAAIREFTQDQATLTNTAFVYRTEIMDEGNGPPKHEFRRLEEATAREYGQCWGVFLAFAMRLRKMELEGDDRYRVTMTPSQKRCVDRAWKYAEKAPGHAQGRRVVLDMSRWFWCPDTMEDFGHLAVDQFDDPTVRYGMLINMREDGSFLAPGNASHLLVRIKYFMRAALFMWSRDTQQRKKLPHRRQHPAGTHEAAAVALLVDLDRGEPGEPVRRDEHARAERAVDDADAGHGGGARHRVRRLPEVVPGGCAAGGGDAQGAGAAADPAQGLRLRGDAGDADLRLAREDRRRLLDVQRRPQPVPEPGLGDDEDGVRAGGRVRAAQGDGRARKRGVERGAGGGVARGLHRVHAAARAPDAPGGRGVEPRGGVLFDEGEEHDAPAAQLPLGEPGEARVPAVLRQGDEHDRAGQGGGARGALEAGARLPRAARAGESVRDDAGAEDGGGRGELRAIDVGVPGAGEGAAVGPAVDRLQELFPAGRQGQEGRAAGGAAVPGFEPAADDAGGVRADAAGVQRGGLAGRARHGDGAPALRDPGGRTPAIHAQHDPEVHRRVGEVVDGAVPDRAAAAGGDEGRVDGTRSTGAALPRGIGRAVDGTIGAVAGKGGAGGGNQGRADGRAPGGFRVRAGDASVELSKAGSGRGDGVERGGRGDQEDDGGEPPGGTAGLHGRRRGGLEVAGPGAGVPAGAGAGDVPAGGAADGGREIGGVRGDNAAGDGGDGGDRAAEGLDARPEEIAGVARGEGERLGRRPPVDAGGRGDDRVGGGGGVGGVSPVVGAPALGGAPEQDRGGRGAPAQVVQGVPGRHVEAVGAGASGGAAGVPVGDRASLGAGGDPETPGTSDLAGDQGADSTTEPGAQDRRLPGLEGRRPVAGHARAAVPVGAGAGRGDPRAVPFVLGRGARGQAAGGAAVPEEPVGGGEGREREGLAGGAVSGDRRDERDGDGGAPRGVSSGAPLQAALRDGGLRAGDRTGGTGRTGGAVHHIRASTDAGGPRGGRRRMGGDEGDGGRARLHAAVLVPPPGRRGAGDDVRGAGRGTVLSVQGADGADTRSKRSGAVDAGHPGQSAEEILGGRVDRGAPSDVQRQRLGNVGVRAERGGAQRRADTGGGAQLRDDTGGGTQRRADTGDGGTRGGEDVRPRRQRRSGRRGSTGRGARSDGAARDRLAGVGDSTTSRTHRAHGDDRRVGRGDTGVGRDGRGDGGRGSQVAAQLPDADGGEEKDGAAVRLVHAASAVLAGARHVPLQAHARRRGVVAGLVQVQGDAVHAGEEGRRSADERDAVLQVLVADGTRPPDGQTGVRGEGPGAADVLAGTVQRPAAGEDAGRFQAGIGAGRRGDVHGMAVGAGARVGVVRDRPDAGDGAPGVAVVGAAREADLPLQMRDRGEEQGGGHRLDT